MKYKVGDVVDLKEWDDTEPPAKRLGKCKVVEVVTGQRSQSGVLLTVMNKRGVVMEGLDSDWVSPAAPTLFD